MIRIIEEELMDSKRTTTYADHTAAAAGTKFRMSLGLPVGAVMNCADNSGAKSESNIPEISRM